MFGSSHEVYVMRHAQSLEDVDSKVRERMSEEDIPLSEEGRAQATVQVFLLHANL